MGWHPPCSPPPPPQHWQLRVPAQGSRPSPPTEEGPSWVCRNTPLIHSQGRVCCSCLYTVGEALGISGLVALSPNRPPVTEELADSLQCEFCTFLSPSLLLRPDFPSFFAPHSVLFLSPIPETPVESSPWGSAVSLKPACAV